MRPPILVVGNIEVKLDFTDVRDVVAAYFALLDRGRSGEIYNVCSGSALRLSTIIAKFEAISRIAVQIDVDPQRLRSNEIPAVFGDATKIRTETGWNPGIPLETTLRDLLSYWREKIKGESTTEDHWSRSFF